MSKIAGVFPVLPTPFRPDGAPDEAAFLRLADFALEAGVDGVVFPGMASEVETLSAAERGALVAALGRRVAGRTVFVVGASHADPAEAAARAREGQAAGAVAAMIMAPPANGQDVAKHVAYYAAVAAAAPGVAIMLQNAPAPNGAGLAPEAVAAIAAEVPQIRTVKEETLPCGQHVTRILAAAKGLANGLDGVMGGAGARFILDELARGACGTMPALELADAHVALWKAWQRGDRAEARRIYNATLPLLAFQMTFRVRATKEVLKRRGLLEHTGARASGPKPDEGDLAEIGELIATARPAMTMHLP